MKALNYLIIEMLIVWTTFFIESTTSRTSTGVRLVFLIKYHYKTKSHKWHPTIIIQ